MRPSKAEAVGRRRGRSSAKAIGLQPKRYGTELLHVETEFLRLEKSVNRLS